MKLTAKHTVILRLAAALLAAAGLSGCAANEAEEPAGPSPLLLTANSAATRAATSLGDTYQDFGVWAWKTDADNTKSIVLGRRPDADAGSEYYTRYTAESKWTYEYTDATSTQYLRYWDPAATDYYFSAYAPYKTGETPLNTTHAITATPDGVSISGIQGNILSGESMDWLEAHWKRQIKPALIDIDLITDTDHIITGINDVVPLTFHHMLALVEFRIYAEGGAPELQSLNISFGAADAVYSLADYAAGAWNYDPDSKQTGLYTLSGVLNLSGTSKENYISLTTLMQIPQNVIGNTIHVNAETTTSATRNGSFTLEENWDAARKYIYYLCITSSEIILLDFETDDWEAGESILITEPVVNW